MEIIVHVFVYSLTLIGESSLSEIIIGLERFVGGFTTSALLPSLRLAGADFFVPASSDLRELNRSSLVLAEALRLFVVLSNSSSSSSLSNADFPLLAKSLDSSSSLNRDA